MKNQVLELLNELQMALRVQNLWEETPPSAEDLASEDPFCVNTLSAAQWLQWIFLPRMHALLEADGELPRGFAITPYLEEAIQDEAQLEAIHLPVLKLERLLNADA